MSPEKTQHAIDSYFKALFTGSFTEFFTDDVTWTTIDTGDVITRPTAVRDAIVALHGNMSDMQTRKLGVSDGAVYLEGDCAGSDGRVPYCVAYDFDSDRIKAMRAYGPIGPFMP